MSYKSDLIYKIAISRIKGVGDITAKKLISHCGSANLVFKENKKSLESIPNINKKIIELINAPDIVRNLNWDVQERSEQQTLFTNFSDEDLKLINVLNTRSLHVDEIKQKLNWDSSKVAKHLLQMEFKNLIISLPGKIYKRRM